jgi:hypothetical protein
MAQSRLSETSARLSAFGEKRTCAAAAPRLVRALLTQTGLLFVSISCNHTSTRPGYSCLILSARLTGNFCGATLQR